MRIFAHRGSSLIWPENTMLAFDLADNAGATGFETDLRLSKDEQIILSHDDNLARFGHSDKTIRRLTGTQISEIEISSADGAFRDKVTSLRALLEKYPNKDYIFDCKISDKMLFERLRQLLTEIQFHDRISFLTWSREGDKHVAEVFPGHKIFPRVFLSVLWGWASILGLGLFFEPKNQALALPPYHFGLPVFLPKQISSIEKRGKSFIGYLINTTKEYSRCLSAGVQTILTDRADLFSQYTEN